MAEADDIENGEEQAAAPVNSLEFLAAAIQSPNMVDMLDEQQLADATSRVVTEYQIDKKSREQWVERNKAALDLAMLVSEQKDYPFTGASNIKFPLLTTAALQFNARAYPAIVQGNRVAKCTTWGRDPNGAKAARADRVSEHLSYQLLSELPEWEEDTDKLLVILPIVGCAFRKVYYDPSVSKNCTRLVTAERLVINYHARSVEDAPRLTEKMYLYPYEIQERIRSGRFIEFNYDGGAEPTEGEQDDDAPQLFLEQHRLLDLDGDSYPEPYVVTVHHSSQKICRIAANFRAEDVHVENGKVTAIRRQSYYVKYPFMPSPDGGIYGWGFGWLLKDIGESINTTLNQMMDAGHLANVQGGLISSQLGIKEKSIKIKMGEYKVVNTSMPLNQAVMPITYPGPSAVLFNLLGLLVEAGKEVSAVKDVLTGDTPTNAPVGTTLAMIEQGLQVFTSIYKRIHRAIKTELGLHAELNRTYLDPERYNRFFDGEMPVDPKADYSEEDMDIMPVSDPNTVSKMQVLAKAMFLKEVAAENPTMNPIEVTTRILEAAQIDDIEKLMLPPPQPNPEEEMLKRIVAMLALKKQEADIVKTQTDSLKNVASAEAQEEGTQIAAMTAYLGHLTNQMKEMDPSNGQGSVSGMEGQPVNSMGSQPAGGEVLASGGTMPQPALPGNGAIPGGMGGAPAQGGL